MDATYQTPAEHNHPMEPHATVAVWHGGTLTVYDSTQGPSRTAGQVAAVFGLEPGQVRVIAEHVGGGFGAKGMPRANVILAAMAARVTGCPVKCAVTRSQMFAVTGHRAPSIQRVRLGAGPDGRLTALCHDVIDQTSTLKEFTEQSAVATRHMYAAPHRRTSHRVVRLDVPTPSWMRAPGECPGMFALESAMDELAVACGIDPVELRLRNEPAVHPETGQPFSSRHLTACLREGAARFGWAGRDPASGARREGRWLTGTGVAASTYPARAMPSQARVTVSRSGRYQVLIAAADIGTGARTALLVVAAETLGVPAAAIDLSIGDSALPPAMIAGGSMGTASWTWAVIKACRALRDQVRARDGAVPPGGLSAHADTTADVGALASGPLAGRARWACDEDGCRILNGWAGWLPHGGSKPQVGPVSRCSGRTAGSPLHTRSAGRGWRDSSRAAWSAPRSEGSPVRGPDQVSPKGAMGLERGPGRFLRSEVEADGGLTMNAESAGSRPRTQGTTTVLTLRSTGSCA